MNSQSSSAVQSSGHPMNITIYHDGQIKPRQIQGTHIIPYEYDCHIQAIISASADGNNPRAIIISIEAFQYSAVPDGSPSDDTGQNDMMCHASYHDAY